MSQDFMNPENPLYSFLHRQLVLVEGRDPLEVLSQTPTDLERRIRGVPDDLLRRRIRPGQWSPKEVMAHLADMEWIFGFRLRTILCDSSPLLAPVDQDRWVELGKVDEKDPRDLLEDFSALRQVNLKLWRRLTPAQMARTGRHPEAELEISLELLLRIQAGHDLSHLEQIETRLEALRFPGRTEEPGGEKNEI